MSNNIEILVPDDAASDTLQSALGAPKSVRFVRQPSNMPASRLMMGLLSSFDSPDGRARWEALVHAARNHVKDTPTIFLSFDLGRRVLSHVAAQTFAMLVSRLRRSKFDPYVAPDAAAVRRLIHAHRINATDKLIASASVEDGNLIVWSCEPKRYEQSIREIPALAALSADQVTKLKVSSSGSRIHWDDGDVDINLETIRAAVDPRVRRAHEAKARKAAKEYASAIRLLRIEKGLKQSDIEGLTARQVRRLEDGNTMPQIETLRQLAAAHGMSTQAYLDELAARSHERLKRRRFAKSN